MRHNVTLSLDMETWKAFRQMCIDRGVTASAEVERLVKQEMTRARTIEQPESDAAAWARKGRE